METEVNRTTEYGLLAAQYLLPLLVAALGWASVKLAAWLRAKTKSQLVMGMLARLTESAYTVATAVEQDVVRAIKRARDPGGAGGVRLTQDEIEHVKASALDALKGYWGEKGLKELGSVLKLDGNAVEGLLKNKLEAAVGEANGHGDPPASPPA